MGSWSHEIFGNDTACDWAGGLLAYSDLSFIKSAIEQVVKNRDYIEAPDSQECLAAIDTLTRLNGHFYQKDVYTEDVDEWVLNQRLTVPEELIEQSKAAIRKICADNSELLELWCEGGDRSEWRSEIDNLLLRLDKDPVELPQPEVSSKEPPQVELQPVVKKWWEFWK